MMGLGLCFSSRVTSSCGNSFGIGKPSSSSSSSIISSSLLPLFLSPNTPPQMRRFGGGVSASHNSTPPSPSADAAIPKTKTTAATSRWKPMYLYYTQNGCTKMDVHTHLHTLNHSLSDQLTLNALHLKHLTPQNFDFFLVLDLEGKVEILEFPLLLIDAKTMDLVHFFHRFVRPTVMSEQRINQYIEGKYRKFGVDRVWHDTAIPFQEVIQQFEDWMTHHHMWTRELGGRLSKAAFITCGNWDLKTKVPQQCKVSRMKVPSYFMEWINIKDVYLNFYKRWATGMLTMMRELQMPLVGSHHLGIDDTKNIARVLQRMIIDGAVLQSTARRRNNSPESVDFLYKNRI